MAKLDFPDNPTSGELYIAPNGVTYTYDDTSLPFGVWLARSTSPLEITSPGIISGTATVGSTLSYAVGTATGGQVPYTYNWEWRRASDDFVIQNNGATLVVPSSLGGDQVYVSLLVLDSVGGTAQGDTESYPAGSFISFSGFPNTNFSPGSGPNASPGSVNTGTLRGTATATWQDGFDTIYTTGSLLFQVNGGGYSSSSKSVTDGDTVDIIWDTAAVASAADGATLTGLFTNGTYENSYSLRVDRAPANFVFNDLSDQSISTQVTSNTVTPTGFNVPVSVSFAGTATPLTLVGLSVGGGSFGSSPQTVTPGQSLQLRGTTGSSNSTTYGVSLSLGSGPAATDTWTVTTTSLSPTISEPTITSPADGSTDVNPSLNSPSAITLQGSAYAPLNGAGAQTGSEWEVYKNGYDLTSTNAITSATVNTYTPSPVSSSFSSTYQTVVTSPDVTVAARYTTTDNNSVIISPYTSLPTADGSVFSAPGAYTQGTYADGVFSIGFNSENGSPGGVFSLDGYTWTQAANLPSSTNYRSSLCCFALGKYWMVSHQTKAISSSTSPTTGWVEQPAPGPSANSYIYLLGNRDIIVYFTDSFPYYSTDGVNWTAGTVDLNIPAARDKVVYENGIFYTPEHYSLDGITWSPRAATQGLPFFDYSKKLYVVVNTSGLYDAQFSVSGDGVNFGPPVPTETNSSLGRLGTALFTVPTGQMGSFYLNNLNYTANPYEAPSSTLLISGALSDGFQVEDLVSSDPAGATPKRILSLSNSLALVSPQTDDWTVGQKLLRDPVSYGPITGSPFTVSAAPYTSINLAGSRFETSTKYFARVRYASASAISNFSAWSSFTTAPEFSIDPGTPFGGGYFAGQITDGVSIYNLIVAPVEEAGLQGQTTPVSGRLAYRTSATADTPSAIVQDEFYGGTTSDLLSTSAEHPVFNSFINGPTGPNAGSLDLVNGGNGGGTGIGGYNDWYLPAKNELEVCYYFLKPESNGNSTTSGSNANAVAPEPTSTNYSGTVPTTTSSTLFQVNQPQAFSTSETYWTSSESSSATTAAWIQGFLTGGQGSAGKNNAYAARAIRRIPA